MSGSTRKYHFKIGDTFSDWTVIDYAEPFVYQKKNGKKDVRIRWLCKCKCGKEKEVLQSALINKESTNCGCKRKEKFTFMKHNLSHTRLYRTYHSMMQRCYNENCDSYKNYGERGIRVCDEWRNDFLSFYNWSLENGYNENCKKYSISLDRIDNNKGYSPDNCRFTTYIIQGNNTRRNHFLTLKGETHTVTEWSRLLDIPISRIFSRINRGWDDAAILTDKVYKGGYDGYKVHNRH